MFLSVSAFCCDSLSVSQRRMMMLLSSTFICFSIVNSFSGIIIKGLCQGMINDDCSLVGALKLLYTPGPYAFTQTHAGVTSEHTRTHRDFNHKDRENT